MGRDLFAAPPRAMGELRDGPVVAIGVVGDVEGKLDLPLPLPAGAPAAERVAVFRIDVEWNPFMARPVRARHERGRTFGLRDATGRALVRVGPLAGDRARADDEVILKLGQPFVAGRDGERDLLVRTLAVGDEVVVVGRVHFEQDASGQGSYREAPRVAVIEADVLFDGPAWHQAAAWHALPWWRKLSLIVRNR